MPTIAPAHARPDPGPAATHPVTDSARFDNDRNTWSLPDPPAAQPGPAVTRFVDDDAVEYVQIGLGALAGIALFGAAAAAVSASHRRHAAHPA